MVQWTMVQAELATLTYPQIGSISSISKTGEAIIDKLSCGPAEGLINQGPFSSAVDYFIAIGEAVLCRPGPSDEDSIAGPPNPVGTSPGSHAEIRRPNGGSLDLTWIVLGFLSGFCRFLR